MYQLYDRFAPLMAVCALIFGSPTYSETLQPLEEFPVLFPAVQQSGIFPDDKFFADATPRLPPEQVREAYRQHLRQFVEQHFHLPATNKVHYQRAPGQPLKEYLESVLTSPSLLPAPKEYDTLLMLPHGFLVSGGTARESYYWDSYFTSVGLSQLGQSQAIRNQLDNMAWLVDEIGHIPNSNRSYALTRSQPPVFALIAELLAASEGEEVLLHYLPQLDKEYQFWMDGSDRLSLDTPAYRRVVRMPDGVVLNRYWSDGEGPRVENYTQDNLIANESQRDPALIFRNIRATIESGWDFSSRWLVSPTYLSTMDTVDVVPIDLNALLYKTERVLSRSYRLSGNHSKADYFHKLAQVRLRTIERFLWDEQLGVYQDYQLSRGVHTGRLSLATCYPLWLNMTTQQKARRIADFVENNFLFADGLAATPGVPQSSVALAWDAPFGWAPLQWISVSGLTNYGFDSLAETIAQRWIRLNQRVFNETGTISAFYDVMKGTTPNRREMAVGGISWAAGTLLSLISRYPQAYQSPAEQQAE